jgi:hypothetical protein
MNSMRRSLVPIIWLVSMTASAAPVGDAHNVDRPNMVNASSPSGNDLVVPRASPADEDADAIMGRVRAVIEELKRQGPPPVDCMEG